MGFLQDTAEVSYQPRP